MMKRFLFSVATMLTMALSAQAKTIVVYYSYTNHMHTIVTDLLTQIEADVVRIQPAVNQDYVANNYAIGSAMISAIRNNPNDASSYPAIQPVEVDWSQYDDVIVATPLWWSQMAAILQTFLFENGSEMAGKRIALIVSSASSGISGVESDVRRLIPDGIHLQPSLWITSANTANCHRLIAEWLPKVNIHTSIDNSAKKHTAGVTMQGNNICVSGTYDRVWLYDVCGNMLLTTTDKCIDMSGYPRGMYVVRIGIGAKAETYKVIY